MENCQSITITRARDDTKQYKELFIETIQDAATVQISYDGSTEGGLITYY